jgi:hypothetical protein
MSRTSYEQKEFTAMKAITTIFESILGNDDSLVWTPTDGPSDFSAQRAWGWTS